MTVQQLNSYGMTHYLAPHMPLIKVSNVHIRIGNTPVMQWLEKGGLEGGKAPSWTLGKNKIMLG